MLLPFPFPIPCFSLGFLWCLPNVWTSNEGRGKWMTLSRASRIKVKVLAFEQWYFWICSYPSRHSDAVKSPRVWTSTSPKGTVAIPLRYQLSSCTLHGDNIPHFGFALRKLHIFAGSNILIMLWVLQAVHAKWCHKWLQWLEQLL